MGNEEVDLISVAKPAKKTLLEKYNIPVNHISYEFISECSDAKTLERIVLILRSGEEGVYPDLTKHAEERLSRIKPTSTILRKAEPVLKRNMLNQNERQEIDNEINSWKSQMQSREKNMNEEKTNFTDDFSPHPEIRQSKPDITKDKKTGINGKRSVKPKRISSCDYAAWDKYDADTEINRIDLQDEQRQVEIKRIQERRKELNKMNKTTLKMAVDKRSLTSTELDVMAAREKEKGNEAFRAADYEVALHHYNSSIEMHSNVMAYNNRAMTFIKLQRYEDALNDCNMVISMDYTNVKALLRRALSLEHLKKADQALADYEAVLKLEPTNKTAISGVNKLREPCKSRKIRMKIQEESMIDSEDVAKTMKSKKSETNGAEQRPKQRVNSEICYCDRAPGSSRNLASKPHIKASYCVVTENSKGTTNAVINKSDAKPTRDESDNKFSSFAKDLGRGNKTSRSRNTVNELDDIFTALHESFRSPRGAEGNLEKSIFSCVSPPHKGKSSVIIEELPSDEVCAESKKTGDSDRTTKERKNESSQKEENDSKTKRSYASKDKKLISPAKESKTKQNFSLNKIQTTGKSKENDQLSINVQKLENVESPYEFLRLWQSLNNNTDLNLHAKLLRSVAHQDMNKFIGNKLDSTMFSLILRCLEQQFCTPKDTHLLADLLYSLSRINRFSIVRMFMDVKDKRALENILRFLEKEKSLKLPELREIYVT